MLYEQETGGGALRLRDSPGVVILFHGKVVLRYCRRETGSGGCIAARTIYDGFIA
jgi:hypothetical protein